MTVWAATAATDAVYDLSEGILWDDRAGVVRWVDIDRGRVLAGELHDDRLVVVEDVSIGQTAGAVALTQDGGLLVAAARGLATISVSGVLSIGPDLLGERTGVRLNDGSADPFGAFVVGTLSLGDDTGNEVLLRVQPDGTVETLRGGIHLSNGIGFSPDGATIYHVDTLAGTVSRHSYGAGPFDMSEPWVAVLGDLSPYPDGLTVDSEGALWIAQWGGSSVRRYALTGELLDIVTVDATQASCVGFVGAGLITVAITTARQGLTDITDRSGAIFMTEAPIPGVSEHRWAGSTTQPYWLIPQKEETNS